MYKNLTKLIRKRLAAMGILIIFGMAFSGCQDKSAEKSSIEPPQILPPQDMMRSQEGSQSEEKHKPPTDEERYQKYLQADERMLSVLEEAFKKGQLSEEWMKNARDYFKSSKKAKLSKEEFLKQEAANEAQLHSQVQAKVDDLKSKMETAQKLTEKNPNAERYQNMSPEELKAQIEKVMKTKGSIDKEKLQFLPQPQQKQ